MSELIWDIGELERFTKWEDAEVRHWAIDRLIRHFPSECCDAVANYVLDEHDSTPTLVARHLGRHGGPQHHAILLRGFRMLRGLPAAHCIQALARLGYPGVVELAASAVKRSDLTAPALATIVEALAELATPDARRLVRDIVLRKVELLAEPAALKGALQIADTSDVPALVTGFVSVAPWGNSERTAEGFR